MSGNKVNKSRVNDLLQQLNLSKVANAKTYNMSQGELQRLSIARAIINNPSVVLADEPTSALDDKNCDEVIRLLENQSQALNSALIIVTHDNRLKKYFPHHLELN